MRPLIRATSLVVAREGPSPVEAIRSREMRRDFRVMTGLRRVLHLHRWGSLEEGCSAGDDVINHEYAIAMGSLHFSSPEGYE